MYSTVPKFFPPRLAQAPGSSIVGTRMEFYCHRCKSSSSEVDEEAFYSGACSTCTGQLLTAPPQAMDNPIGVVAQTFEEKSAVAAPIATSISDVGIHDPPHLRPNEHGQMIWVEQENDSTNAATEPHAGADSAESVKSPMPAVPQAAVDAAEAEAEATHTPVAEPLQTPAESNESNSWPDDHTPPPTESTPPETGAVEPQSGEDMPETNPAGPDQPPANAETSDADDVNQAAGLPAHLSLPTFPTFNIDFDTSNVLTESKEETETESTEKAVDPNAGGVADLPPLEPPVEPSPSVDPALTNSTGPSDASHLAPPPIPSHALKPPPPTSTPEPTTAPLLPTLPDFGGAEYTESSEKRDVTLLGDQAVAELAQRINTGGGRKTAIGVAILCIIAVTAAWVYLDDIVGLVDQPQNAVAGTSKADKATGMLISASTAFEQKKFDAAIKLYVQALSIDPLPTSAVCNDCWQGKAHRNVAISFATLKKQAKAVKHYRAYLKLQPKASDAAEVRAIVEAYEKAKKEGKNIKRRK